MPLFAEPGGVIPTPWTPFTIAPTGTLEPLRFFICNCDHRLTYQYGFT